jgi:arginine decarboxylase
VELCDETGSPHPTIVSESGRAIAAHHAVLVVNVLGVSEFNTSTSRSSRPSRAAAGRPTCGRPTRTSREELPRGLPRRREYKDEAISLFNLGYLSLELTACAIAENLFWAICDKILLIVARSTTCPRSSRASSARSADTYFCNFSMFQSLPDSLGGESAVPDDADPPAQRTSRRAARVLADITCDSDGKIDQFIDLRDVKNVLELHPVTAGAAVLPRRSFLVGAYQEILGDLHNLFGDTNT